MADVMVNIAAILWMALALIVLFGLIKWNKRFQELYEELMEDMHNG